MVDEDDVELLGLGEAARDEDGADGAADDHNCALFLLPAPRTVSAGTTLGTHLGGTSGRRHGQGERP